MASKVGVKASCTRVRYTPEQDGISRGCPRTCQNDTPSPSDTVSASMRLSLEPNAVAFS